MSLLLYAITTAGQEPSGAGLGGNPLRAVEANHLVAIVSALSDDQEPAEETLWEYDQVLERLMANHVLLPARFGTVLSDCAAVRELLGRRRGELRAALDRVGGAVEFGVTTGWGEVDDPAESSSGTDYLFGRLALHHRASDVARRLEPLAAVSRSSRQRVLPRPSLPVTAAYLVEEKHREEFIEIVAHLDSLLAGVDIVCTGPWPPYSFVEGVPR